MPKFAAFLAELRQYRYLALQLPQRVCFPMFEVGLNIVNSEIKIRIEKFIFTVLTRFEEDLMDNTKDICGNYEEIQE